LAVKTERSVKTATDPNPSDELLTPEDVTRSGDRRRVLEARHQHRRFGLLWLLVGPGILVLLGENDGPSMLSYAATGARFGIGFFLPFIVLTFLMAIVVQEMTVRLGAVTHRGHAELIFERFGPFCGWFSMIDLGIGNFLTLITEFIAIRAGLGFFGVPPWAAVLAALVLSPVHEPHWGIGQAGRGLGAAAVSRAIEPRVIGASANPGRLAGRGPRSER